MVNPRRHTNLAGTLSHPSKMPGTAYGLPAQACIIGSELARIPGTTCSSCYALRNRYLFPNVKASLARRLASITHPDWVEAIIDLLETAHAGGELPPYHRWHDSGDLQSRDHLAKICAVARATPWLRHWLPTREAKIVCDFVRDGGTIPSNLVIRLSAAMVDGLPPKAWPLTSTVHSHSFGRLIMVEGQPTTSAAPVGYICPAPQQLNKCGACRACWSAEVANVSYHQH